MGTSCTKPQRQRATARRRDFVNFKDYLLTKLRIRKRDKNQLQPGAPPNSPYNGSQQSETEVRPFTPLSNVTSDTSSNSLTNNPASRINSIPLTPAPGRNTPCSTGSTATLTPTSEYIIKDDAEVRSLDSSLDNDQQELELIDLDDNQQSEVNPTFDTRDRRIRPTAAFGARPIAPMLPAFVRELNKDVQHLISGPRPGAAVGVRTPMRSATFLDTSGESKVMSLPGEVVPSDEYFSQRGKSHPLVSRPQLTVPAVKTSEQKVLDEWIKRQQLVEHASDSEGDSDSD